MEISSLQILAIFIVSAVAGMGSVLDELQTHRPLIACTFTGLILGDMTTGIIIGGTLEMIALGWMNIGAAMAPDAALASVISTILVIAGHQTIGAGIAIAMPLAAAGQVLTILCRTLTVVFQHQADRYAERGELRGIDICHLAHCSSRRCASLSRLRLSPCTSARVPLRQCLQPSRRSSRAACRSLAASSLS